MSKIILTETQYKKLIETGAANAAMDLDIYVQPVERDTSHGNENVIDSIDNIISKLSELKNMFNVGKKVPLTMKNTVFTLDDEVKKILDSIKSKV